jgi:hypothetical protein
MNIIYAALPDYPTKRFPRTDKIHTHSFGGGVVIQPAESGGFHAFLASLMLRLGNG